MRRTAALRSLALVGLVAPILFTALVAVQGWIQPDYNHVAMPISALAAWPAGWLQTLNFYGLGASMAAFAFGLHLSIRRSRYGEAAIAPLLVSSAGIFVAAIFPWIRVDGVPVETPGHAVGAIMTFLGASFGMIAVSRRMAKDPDWSDFAPFVLAAGIGMLALFLVLGAFAIDPRAPLHRWAGLLQRLVLALWFPCVIAASMRMLRIARTPVPPAIERAA
jgi:hypothetical membrane protein